MDVFLPNNQEGELITGEVDPVRQAEVFRQLRAQTVVITMGGDGAVLVSHKSGYGPACSKCRSWTALAAVMPSMRDISPAY